DLQRVVRAAVDEPVTVLVDIGPIAVHPDAGPPRPVRLEIALRVAPEPRGHAGPGPRHDELAHFAADGPALLAVALGRHARDGAVERTGLDRRDGKRREDAAGDLGAARVVDDRHALLADVLEEPAVGFGIPRLAGRPDD